MIKKNKPIDAFGIGRVSNEKSKSTSTFDANGTKNISVPSDLTPFDIFMRCIKRAENLINFHSEDKNPEEEHFCDAYRASVVLTIAALDAYTRTVAIIKIKEKLKRKPKQNDPLCIYIKTIMTHDTLLECAMNDSFFYQIETEIANDFQKKSFQGERKISHYMELAGYKNIFGMVSKKDNSNEHNLKTKIDDFTKRRHTIAHGGDYDINQIPYREIEIKKEYAVECHKIVINFTKTLNEICFKK
jgi:hypothetical protein